MFGKRNFNKNQPKFTQDTLSRAVNNMIASQDLETAIEGKTILTAAIADSGMILRFTDGTKLTYNCLGGRCNIECP